MQLKSKACECDKKILDQTYESLVLENKQPPA